MPFDHDSPTPHNVRTDEAKAAIGPAGLTFQPGTLISGRFRVVRFIARSDAVRLGLPRYEFEARRALAAIEGPRSTAGAARIAALQQDAQQRGFLLYTH